MQVQHKQAIVVLQKVLIVTIFITISAMSAHATTLIGKDIRDILSKIESQAFLNTIYFCKSDSDYYGIPREEIQRIYTFQGTNNRSYDLIYCYSNNKKNPGTNYVDGIYIAPKLMDEVKDDAFRIVGISVIKEADNSQTLAFNVVGYKAFVDPVTHISDALQVTGLFVPPKSVGEEILFLVANNQRNSTGYAFLNGAQLIKDMESIERSNATLESRIIKAF